MKKGLSRSALEQFIRCPRCFYQQRKLGWVDVTVDVIGAVINGTDLGIDVETMDTNRWSLQLVRDEGMYCYY